MHNMRRGGGGGSGSGGGDGGNRWGSASDRVAETNRRLLEQQNDSSINTLADQLGRLKELSIDINEEVADQNRMLDGMGNQMNSASGLLNETLGKLGTMLKSGGSKHMGTLPPRQRPRRQRPAACGQQRAFLIRGHPPRHALNHACSSHL